MKIKVPSGLVLDIYFSYEDDKTKTIAHCTVDEQEHKGVSYKHPNDTPNGKLGRKSAVRRLFLTMPYISREDRECVWKVFFPNLPREKKKNKKHG